jgi:[ribosomal protein S5]-alanine N-acetyltransferase
MLTDGTIRLEPLGDQHLAGLAGLGRDPLIQRNTRVPEPWIEGFERQWLDGYEEGWAVGTQAGFAIVEPATGEFLGIAGLVDIQPEARQGEIGYLVTEPARGRGIATRALAFVTEYALDERKLERVELLIATDNEASIRVAEHGGYKREGVLRSYGLKPGHRADMAVYSRLPTD